jgi:ABC-2 type transport system ATP-binding protein
MGENEEIFAIVTEELTKSYGRVEALRGVNLQVNQGEVFGFLGPNGAGKTTTIRCLLDQIRPDSGKIKIFSIDPQIDPVKVKAFSGYLPGELHLNPNMTAEKQLRYFNDLRNGGADWSQINQLADRLKLDLRRPIKNLSKGNKQKVGVIQALMHRPQLLLLDEPTSGLDPLMQQEVLSLIREANDRGATVFFSSHVMSEVEAVAQRVGIIRQGKIVEVASTTALTDRSLIQATVRFHKPVDYSALADLANVNVVSQDDGLSASFQVWGDMDGLIKALARYPVVSLETDRPSLEELFLEYYRSENDIKEIV